MWQNLWYVEEEIICRIWGCHAWRNLERIKFLEFLLLRNAKSFVVFVAIKNTKTEV